MAKEPKARRYADDAPLTAKELKTARRLSARPPDFIAAVRNSVRGRPLGRRKEPVHLSLDIDLVQAMRRTGRGWQTRANAMLRKSMKLPASGQTTQD
jgi:uncharacterized protein (DUF4415 family)